MSLPQNFTTAPPIDFVKLKLISWASRQTNVRKVWLYGSRLPASGKEPRPDSDWDVAIEIYADTPESARRWWFEFAEDINAEIGGLLRWDAHVQPHNPPQTENVTAAVESYATLIYPLQ